MAPRTEKNLPVIVDSREFVARLAEEVKRSDRYEHPFTMLILRPPVCSGQGDLAAAEWFKALASGLVRGCDIVSVFEAERIVAVLLPETGVSGGAALLERFRTAISDTDDPWDFRLLEYPQNRDKITELTKRAA